MGSNPITQLFLVLLLKIDQILDCRPRELSFLFPICNTNYYNFLVTPRVLSLTFALPIFVTLVDFIGVMGGYIVSVYRLGFNDNLYLLNTINFLSLGDYLSGILKAIAFGFIISTVSCYCGLFSDKGAFGVGSATTNAVVVSSILILSSNYFLTELFF